MRMYCTVGYVKRRAYTHWSNSYHLSFFPVPSLNRSSYPSNMKRCHYARGKCSMIFGRRHILNLVYYQYMISIIVVLGLLIRFTAGFFLSSQPFDSKHVYQQRGINSISSHMSKCLHTSCTYYSYGMPYSRQSAVVESSISGSTSKVGSLRNTVKRDTALAASIGLWEEVHGNYILRPKSKEQSPRALIHFLGGAIVGAAPDITYRYILETLADNGFLIVATPYQLSFDYLVTCDDIIHRFEKIAPDLARTFGALPVIGVGHSCGALLQLLITSLFPDTPRAANVLISFNNKPATEAVPFFQELVAPFFVAITAENSTLPNAVDVLNSSLQILRALGKGSLPSDEVLTDLVQVITPNILPMESIRKPKINIPDPIRTALQQLLQPVSNTKRDVGLLPIVDQTVDILEQIPSLIQEVADGARDFDPPPAAVKAAVRRSYRARRTLIINYEGDTFDESEDVEKLLKESESLMRMRKPMLPFDVQRITLQGIHATPCIAPPRDIAIRAEDILGNEFSKERLLYTGADNTVTAILTWLEGQL